MHKDYKTVADVITGAFTGNGIFSAFNNPIWCYDFNSEALDIQFITNYGDKPASPYLLHFDEDGGISDENLQAIADHIYAMNKYSWEHLYKAVTTEYEPLYNVDAYESEKTNSVNNNNSIDSAINTESSVNNDANTDSIDRTSTSSNINSGSGDTDSSGNGDSINDISAFNSGLVNDTANDSNTDAITGTSNEASGITNEESTDSHDIAGSDSHISDTGVDRVVNTNGTSEGERVVRRYGNIGVTTSAQMISGEIELWKFNYMARVMSDICELIALSIY